MVYTRSHRTTFEQEWKYTFPKHKSKQWFMATRDAPELPWSRDAVGKAELRTRVRMEAVPRGRRGGPGKTADAGD